MTVSPSAAPAPSAAVSTPNPRRDLVVAGLLLLLAGLLSLAAAGPGVLPGDLGGDRLVGLLPAPWFDWIAFGFSRAGSGWVGFTALALVVMLLLLARRRRRLALFVGLAALTRLIVAPLKSVIASRRPTADLVQIGEARLDYGFPSGHTFAATVLFGSLCIVLPALVARRAVCRLLQGVCLATIVLMGLSRIRVGAHWPSDVLGGILWGAAALAVLSALAALWIRRTTPAG